MIFASATLVAPGTPQSVAVVSMPPMPSMTVRGVTYPAGSATQRVRSMSVQAGPANTGANIYLGGRQMNKVTGTGVGMILLKGAPPLVLGDGEGFALDDMYFDGDTAGDLLLFTIIG